MTFADKSLENLLIEKGFVITNTNKSDEPQYQYRLFQRSDIFIDFFAGWCTVYRKKTKITDFELCTDLSTKSLNFKYKEIPKSFLIFITSLPPLNVPDGVTLFAPGYKSRVIPKKLKLQVMEKCNRKCVNCDSKEHLCYDHIFPVSKGGPTVLENLQILCRLCNLRKSDKI